MLASRKVANGADEPRNEQRASSAAEGIPTPPLVPPPGRLSQEELRWAVASPKMDKVLRPSAAPVVSGSRSGKEGRLIQHGRRAGRAPRPRPTLGSAVPTSDRPVQRSRTVPAHETGRSWGNGERSEGRYRQVEVRRTRGGGWRQAYRCGGRSVRGRWRGHHPSNGE